MSKHTKGRPWKYHAVHKTTSAEPTYWTEHERGMLPLNLNMNTVEGSANACLIASAPEMLEALKEMASGCKCTVKERMSGHLVECSVPRALEVIAKAEGREKS